LCLGVSSFKCSKPPATSTYDCTYSITTTAQSNGIDYQVSSSGANCCPSTAIIKITVANSAISSVGQYTCGNCKGFIPVYDAGTFTISAKVILEPREIDLINVGGDYWPSGLKEYSMVNDTVAVSGSSYTRSGSYTPNSSACSHSVGRWMLNKSPAYWKPADCTLPVISAPSGNVLYLGDSNGDDIFRSICNGISNKSPVAGKSACTFSNGKWYALVPWFEGQSATNSNWLTMLRSGADLAGLNPNAVILEFGSHDFQDTPAMYIPKIKTFMQGIVAKFPTAQIFIVDTTSTLNLSPPYMVLANDVRVMDRNRNMLSACHLYAGSNCKGEIDIFTASQMVPNNLRSADLHFQVPLYQSLASIVTDRMSHI
jgi:hypothetical protein